MTDLEWWLASKDIVETELEEKPKKSPKAVKTTSTSVARRRDSESDEDYDNA